jgi:four helix bundle protein
MYFKDLVAWQRAVDLAVRVYDVTDLFPRYERYGIVSQMTRAGVSVPSNIAESQGRLTRGEAKKHLGDARASLWELETQLEISRRRGYVSEAEVANLSVEISRVGRLLSGLIRYTMNEQRKEGSKSYAKSLEEREKD